MSRSASCSSSALRWTAVVIAVCSAATLNTAPKVFLSRDAALVKVFGEETDVERRTAFLTEDQLAAARELAGPGIDVRSAMIVRYVARRDGEPLGTAYFDTHRVRTLQETLMVVVAPSGRIDRVEILTFDEPGNYLPREAWYRQFDGLPLDVNLALKRGVHGITGATLSAEAATDAVRRVMAIHTVLEEDRP